MHIFATLMAVLVLFVSCASTAPVTGVDIGALPRDPVPALSMDVGFDLFMFRVDLLRGTHESMEIDSDGRERTIIEPNEYSPLVIDFGGGILLDYQGNLCLDLVRLYGLENAARYTIISEPVGRGSRGARLEVEDGRYRLERKGSRPPLETGRISKTEGTDDRLRNSIRVGEQGAVNTMRNVLGMSTTAALYKHSPHQTARPNLIGQTIYTLVDGRSIYLGDGITLEHGGDHILVGDLTMIRSGNSIHVFDKRLRGFELRREGNTVTHLVDGKPTRTYTLEIRE